MGTWIRPEDWSPKEEQRYPWKQYVNQEGELFYKREDRAVSQWECPRDFVAPYPAPLGQFRVQEDAPSDCMHSALYRNAIKLHILKDRAHLGNILRGIGLEQRGFPVETLFQLSAVARAPR